MCVGGMGGGEYKKSQYIGHVNCMLCQQITNEVCVCVCVCVCACVGVGHLTPQWIVDIYAGKMLLEV